MERTRYRYILPEKIKFIPNEGFDTMEMVYYGYPFKGWRAVYYVSKEDHEHCKVRCPHTGEYGQLDRQWLDDCELYGGRLFDEDVNSLPQIISIPENVYVLKNSQVIAEFRGYDSEGLFYDGNKALEYAKMFCDALNDQGV